MAEAPTAMERCAGTSFRAPRLRHNRGWLALGMAPFAVVLGLVLGALLTGIWAMLVPCLHFALLGALGTLWSYRSNRDARSVPGTLEVGERGVVHDGQLLAEREGLTQGFLVPEEGRTVLRLHRKGLAAPLAFAFDDPADGRAALRALGFDAARSVAELRAASDFFRWSLGRQAFAVLLPVFGVFVPIVLTAAALFDQGSAPFLGLAVVLLLAYLFGMLFTPTRVRVGVDGVATRWLGHERFVPLADVSAVEPYREEKGGKVHLGVELALRTGAKERIPAGQEGFTFVDPVQLAERIREALAVNRAGGGAQGARAVDHARLAPRDRDVRSWLRALRGLGEGAGADMRTAPTPPDDLLAVVEDPAAPALVRAGAAVAALPTLREDARARIRIAAHATASRPLRVALERVLDSGSDDDAVADALAELQGDAALRAPIPNDD